MAYFFTGIWYNFRVALTSTFSNLIPAPDETYTNLFLAHDNMELDKKLQDIKDKSMESKRKS